MSDPSYNGPERRTLPLTEDRVRLMIEQSVEQAMETHEDKMTKVIKAEFTKLEDTIKSAFPGGDPHGHRMAHEKAIKDATRWDELKAEFVSKAFTTGMFAALAFVLLWVWEGFKESVKR
jgi:hypothetical protein